MLFCGSSSAKKCLPPAVLELDGRQLDIRPATKAVINAAKSNKNMSFRALSDLVSEDFDLPDRGPLEPLVQIERITELAHEFKKDMGVLYPDYSVLGVPMTTNWKRNDDFLPWNAILKPLPPGWKERQNAEGRTFYLHAATDESTWERPKENESTPPVSDNFVNLEALSRKDLQNLAKENNIKANLKSSDIITQLQKNSKSPSSSLATFAATKSSRAIDSRAANETTNERPLKPQDTNTAGKENRNRLHQREARRLLQLILADPAFQSVLNQSTFGVPFLRVSLLASLATLRLWPEVIQVIRALTSVQTPSDLNQLQRHAPAYTPDELYYGIIAAYFLRQADVASDLLANFLALLDSTSATTPVERMLPQKCLYCPEPASGFGTHCASHVEWLYNAKVNIIVYHHRHCHRHEFLSPLGGQGQECRAAYWPWAGQSSGEHVGEREDHHCRPGTHILQTYINVETCTH